MEFSYAGFTFRYDSQYLKHCLFIAISGAHSYGWARKDSDLDVRDVWIPDLLQAISIMDRGRVKERHDGNIDYVSYPIHHFLRLLAKGNGNCLENLFQDKVQQNEALVKQLQELTMENLHIAFLKHYYGYSDSLRKDRENPTRLQRYGLEKLLLCEYRVLQAGIILAETQRVVYNVREQAEKFTGTTYCIPLLSKYLKGQRPQAYEGPLEELDALRGRLKKDIEECKWFKTFPSNVYDRWLLNYFKP